MRMSRKCCVLNCDTDSRAARDHALPCHRFPKDGQLRDKWLSSQGFPETFEPTPGQVVCYKHFRRADYESLVANDGFKYELVADAVPSVFDDYENHPDPLTPQQLKGSTYPQDDLELINSGMTKSYKQIYSSSLYSPTEGQDEVALPRMGEEEADPLAGVIGTDTKENDCQSLATIVESVNNCNENSVAVQLGIIEPPSNCDNGILKEAILNEQFAEFDSNNKTGIKSSDQVKVPVAQNGNDPFTIGAKIEAKDFNDKWYEAKVVEADYIDREVLIKYDKHSTRFDEWIPMDSSRLRPPQTPINEESWILQSPENRRKVFTQGERVLATWADGRKYPAQVTTVLENDRYDVLFDDGYAKVVKSTKMTKIASTTVKQNNLEAQEVEYLGSKQERRDRKRKHNVMDLFHHHGKKRAKLDGDKSLRKDESGVVVSENGHEEMNGNGSQENLSVYSDASTDGPRGLDSSPVKVKNHRKRSKKDVVIKSEIDLEENESEWINGEPNGIQSVIVDSNDVSRPSYVMPDKRLPPGWQKHFVQRRSGNSAGKWDVIFIHESTGKRFRSRHDIKSFIESHGLIFNNDNFDFCVRRKKNRHSFPKTKQDSALVVEPKKIKTLLPKTKSALNTPECPVTPVNSLVAPLTPAPTLINDAVYIGGLRVEMVDSAYKCPKEGCGKNFRKENLLQMHIKHYHPEYSKFLGSTPNVADLAYARTIGEPLEDIIPKKTNNFLEKINKFEKRKATQDVSPSTLSPLPPYENGTSEDPDKLNLSKDDPAKLDTSSVLNNIVNSDVENLDKRRDNNCAMSPGSLFDMRTKDDKIHGGIKTLLPVRHSLGSELPRHDRSKSLDVAEKARSHRKRHLHTEYSLDTPNRYRKRHSTAEYNEDYADFDDSALDADGPTSSLSYRFSRRKSDSKSDENAQNNGEGVMMMINGELKKIEHLKREEIINCTCGIVEEDGLMIQCDVCLCWQHGHCNLIGEEQDVPEKYICFICRHSYRQRPSKKYFHDQEWMKEGKLASLPTRTKNQNVINQRTAMLKRSYDLVAALLQIQQVLQSLKIKISVAQQKDHPKLYLWAKSWEKTEIPKADVETVPVMEIIKPPVVVEEVNQSTAVVKSESEVKDELDEKSITSDTELMKILGEESAEDSSQIANDVKLDNCKEDVNQNNTHILLNALTTPENKSSDSEETIKEEVTDPSEVDDKESLEVKPTELEATVNEEEKKPLEPPPDIPISLPQELPMQPFIPEPEAPIDPTECRMRLLEHIEHFQNHIDSKLTTIEAHVCVLETMDPNNLEQDLEVPRTKQTVQMLLRDLNTVRKLASLC